MPTTAQKAAVLLFGRRLTLAQQYDAELTGIAAANLIDYWKLDETSGTTAVDSINTARNGTYANITLNASTWQDAISPVGRWDGTNGDVCTITSASLASAFNGQEGTIAFWFQVFAASVWTDATARRFAILTVDANNRVILDKSSTNNTLAWTYVAGGTTKSVTTTTSSTAWLHMAITYSKAADQMKAYLSGAQVGATQTGLGTFAGSLASAFLGATSGAGGAWNGYLSRAAIWTTPLSSTQIAQIASVP